MPGVFGNEDRSALFKRVTYIIQYVDSATFQDIEAFVHLEVSVDGNTGADHNLLSAHGEISGPCGSTDFNEDVPVVTEMNEMFAFGGAEHITLPSGRLSGGDALRQNLADAETSQTKKQEWACLPKCVNDPPSVRSFSNPPLPASRPPSRQAFRRLQP